MVSATVAQAVGNQIESDFTTEYKYSQLLKFTSSLPLWLAPLLTNPTSTLTD